MKITTLYDDQSHSLPWVSSPAPEELSVTRLSDLFSKALGRPPTKPGTRRAVAKIMLRWPDLRRVATVPESVLAKEGGLTPTQARKFLATVNLAFALAGMSQRCAKTITTPEEALPYLRSLTLSRVERFWVIALDVRARCLGVREVARGTLAGCPVPIRDVFAFLLDYDAHRAIVAHNHPGGTASPSSEDLLFTRRLVQIGEALGVPIVDHLIVTQTSFTSLSALGEVQ